MAQVERRDCLGLEALRGGHHDGIDEPEAQSAVLSGDGVRPVEIFGPTELNVEGAVRDIGQKGVLRARGRIPPVIARR